MDYYRQFLKLNELQVGTLEKNEASRSSFTKAHNYVAEFERLLQVIEGPEKLMLELALSELQMALYFAATAQYRSAYVSLRLFFELALGGILFSTNLIKLKKWKTSGQDIVWESLVNDDNGVFSHDFAKTFLPGLEEHAREYRGIAKTAYRECSEYVHGNIGTFNVPVKKIEFDQELLAAWLARAEAVYGCVLFAFASRYLMDLTPERKRSIEDTMLSNFNHLPTIRQIYEAP